MKKTDFYNSAHLVVAAIRVLEHQNNMPPSVENLCTMLSFSKEHGNFICKKLKDLEIINIVEGAFGRKLYVQDHMKLEAIPTSAEESSIGEEVKKFKDARKKNEERIKSIKEQQEKKRKDLFAELNRQLKDGFKTKK